MEILTLILTFECAHKIKQRPHLLRGYFGRRFKEYVLMHQHMVDGKFLYKYPMVQYKIYNGNPTVIGIDLGAEVLKRIYNEVNILEFNGERYEIFGKNISVKKVDLGIDSKMTHYTYHFLTPWLALNEKNYEKYRKAQNWEEKREILKKCLTANLISMSKGIGYTVPGPIEVKLRRIKEIRTSLKGTPMLGFLGTFSVNFQIPDLWGIGKSVSRGFGTVRRMERQRGADAETQAE